MAMAASSKQKRRPQLELGSFIILELREEQVFGFALWSKGVGVFHIKILKFNFSLP